MAENKVAVVTGTNRGIGVEITRQLAALGITVVATARDQAKAEAIASQLKGEGLDVHAAKLDVTSASEIEQLVKFISEKFGRLDILVNNAGIMEKENQPSVDDFRAVLEANVVGVYALTEALLPLLKASPAGRIVNQSSILGSLSIVSKGQGGGLTPAGYTASKAALNMLTALYSQLLKGTKIKVNSAHPGWVKTDMGGAGAQIEVEAGAKTAVQLATLADDGPTGGFVHLGRSMPW